MERIRVLLAVALLAQLAGGCRQRETASPPPDPAAESTPVRVEPLATLTAADPPLRIDVTAVRRLARDIVEIQVDVINPDPARPLLLGSRFAETDGEAGTFSAAHLSSEAGTARYFVLRDREGRPACSVDAAAIPPGGRRPAWMRFASPGRAAGRVTLQLKGLPPLPGLPLTAAP